MSASRERAGDRRATRAASGVERTIYRPRVDRSTRSRVGRCPVRWHGVAALERTSTARRFLERCRLFALAESLGGVESLIEHPAIMTHASVPADVRAALGIGDSLVRLSVGIEDVDDLTADLEQALAAV
jgi:hypothetical protein